jgi:hypothetical protein
VPLAAAESELSLEGIFGQRPPQLASTVRIGSIAARCIAITEARLLAHFGNFQPPKAIESKAPYGCRHDGFSLTRDLAVGKNARGWTKSFPSRGEIIPSHARNAPSPGKVAARRVSVGRPARRIVARRTTIAFTETAFQFPSITSDRRPARPVRSGHNS